MKDIINFTELVDKLQELNKDAVITIAEDCFNTVWCSKSTAELVLPPNFYLKNGEQITNKHRTQTGAYTTADVMLM